MKEKRISFCQGKGSLTHDNREFIAGNVDKSRIKDNITFVRQDLGEAYDILFKESTERYNSTQKRNDRKINCSYYESVFHQKPSSSVVTAADKRKSFYEDVVQIGKMDDSGVGSADAELVAECLKEYMNGYQLRNPNFYVFNAVLHMDEATPHLHIDYIPFGHYKRGQDIQNGIAQALKEMGFGTGKNAIARWRASEIEVLNRICYEHGIQPLEPEKSRGSMSVEEYREYARIHEQKISEERTLSDVHEQLEEEKKLLKETSELTAKIKKLDSIETRKNIFGGKITVSSDDYSNILKLAKKQISEVQKERKTLKENEELKSKISDQEIQINELKNELSKYKQPAYSTIGFLKKEAQEISEKEAIKSRYNKAISFIKYKGLDEEFSGFRPANIRKYLE